MKKFLPGLGGHPIKNDDAKLMQDAYLLGFQAISSYLSNSQNVILNGVVVTNNLTTVTNTAGYVIWQGEIYVVPAGSFPNVNGGLYFFKLTQTTIPPSPTGYKDGSIQNVHVDRQLTLKYYSSGDTGEYYTNFQRVSTGAVPSGTLLDWYGNVNANFDTSGQGINALSGYHICNGVGGTPDLRGVFVVSATNVPNTGAPVLDSTVGTYNYTDRGGAVSVVLTKPNMPNYALTINENGGHDHATHGQGPIIANGNAVNYLCRVPGNNRYSGSGNDNFGGQAGVDLNMRTSKNTIGITVSSGGSDTGHENRPPFFAAIKIIKL